MPITQQTSWPNLYISVYMNRGMTLNKYVKYAITSEMIHFPIIICDGFHKVKICSYIYIITIQLYDTLGYR